MSLDFSPFDPQSTQHLQIAAEIWNTACGQEYHITPAFVAYNTRTVPGYTQAGQIAWRGGEPVGIALASALKDRAASPMGWLDAIAVWPPLQGVGSQLLAWAESWLHAQGCQYLCLGCSIRPFTPGLPLYPPDHSNPSGQAFFSQRGFTHPASPQDWHWDVACDLGDYRPDPPYTGPAEFHPCQPGEEPALLEFLRREFPGRWQFEAEDYLRIGGRVSEFMLAWIEDRVEGFCWCTYPDSQRPLERYYHNQLPQPWGQAGPLGVSQAVRGLKLGRAVVNAALARMQAQGIRGCVIDWTGLLDFYAIFGFEKYHAYLPLYKQLTGS